MNKLKQLKTQALKNPEVRREYELLADEFSLIDKLLSMRATAGLTQEALAQRMGTNKSNICRLEKGNTNPNLGTLKKYAKACGFELTMEFHTA